ncbi:hypothetical protein [Candidatus Chlorohelix sp.]|uniref:hypothetical protein n=1 Tax=Candidatus Chlorohelix sp. TaxID=3139201 RepID=UPI00305EC854
MGSKATFQKPQAVRHNLAKPPRIIYRDGQGRYEKPDSGIKLINYCDGFVETVV